MKALKNKAFLDFVERTTATFFQAFIAVELVDPTNLSNVNSYKVAGAAGALAAGKFVYMKLSAYLSKPTPPVA